MADEKTPSDKKKSTHRNRSAVSGKYVQEIYAKRHPDTTIKEKIKKPTD